MRSASVGSGAIPAATASVTSSAALARALCSRADLLIATREAKRPFTGSGSVKTVLKRGC